MFPNLGGLTLTSTTGVTTHPDGSRTFTAEELATLTQLLGPVPALMPTPAPTPAPPPAQRQRRTEQPRDDRPLTMPELLKADDLANILGAIGRRDQSKRSACHDALTWCNLNTDHQAACDGAIPDVWVGLAERIFGIPGTERRPPGYVSPDGDNLIYLAYRNDDNPQEAFNGMCRAVALGDVLAKRFAMFAIDQYKQMLESEDAEARRRQRLSFRYATSFSYLDEWQERATALFKSAPLSGMCKDMYRDRPLGEASFKDVVDLVFSATASYLFSGDKNFKNLAEKEEEEEVDEMPSSESEEAEEEEEEEEYSDGFSSGGSDDGPDPDRYGIGQEEAIYAIGEALGVYIVGLCQLQRNPNAWKQEFVTEVRVQIAHAVDRVLYGPNAMVPTEYAEYNQLQEQLHDMDGVMFFDMFEE